MPPPSLRIARDGFTGISSPRHRLPSLRIDVCSLHSNPFVHKHTVRHSVSCYLHSMLERRQRQRRRLLHGTWAIHIQKHARQNIVDGVYRRRTQPNQLGLARPTQSVGWRVACQRHLTRSFRLYNYDVYDHFIHIVAGSAHVVPRPRV